MDQLTLFGVIAVTAMLIFYALEDRSRWFILAFAGACALGSIYGFLQGAWPFGVIEAIWAGIACVTGRNCGTRGDRVQVLRRRQAQQRQDFPALGPVSRGSRAQARACSARHRPAA
jgi:hypothetical protein